MEKTHNTEGLGSENISMFFSNSIANKKGFLPRPARFRSWTLGAGEAGVNLVDTGRTLTASWTTGWAQSFIPTVYTGGAVYAETSTATQASVTATDPVIQPFHVVFDAARVWGEHAATEFSPAHVRLPVILYLGLLPRSEDRDTRQRGG